MSNYGAKCATVGQTCSESWGSQTALSGSDLRCPLSVTISPVEDWQKESDDDLRGGKWGVPLRGWELWAEEEDIVVWHFWRKTWASELHCKRHKTDCCPTSQLNGERHRFGIENSPLCSCESGAIETVDHYLTNCPKYDQQRSKLMRGVGVGGMWIDKLLGDINLVKHTLEYVRDTQRFDF